MDYDTINACLDQKIILLKKIKELSKEIELHCCESDRDPAELPSQRQIYIDRLKKCESLLSSHIGQLAPEDRERLRKVLAEGGKNAVQGTQELALYEASVHCRTLLRDTLAMDAISLQRMKEQRDELSNQISQGKKSNHGQMTFYSLH